MDERKFSGKQLLSTVRLKWNFWRLQECKPWIKNKVNLVDLKVMKSDTQMKTVFQVSWSSSKTQVRSRVGTRSPQTFLWCTANNWLQVDRGYMQKSNKTCFTITLPCPLNAGEHITRISRCSITVFCFPVSTRLYKTLRKSKHILQVIYSQLY